MHYKLCIFDFGGTFANTRGAVLRSMLAILKDVSIEGKPITIDDIEAILATPPLRDTFTQLLGPGTSRPDIYAVALRYRAAYSGLATRWLKFSTTASQNMVNGNCHPIFSAA